MLLLSACDLGVSCSFSAYAVHGFRSQVLHVVSGLQVVASAAEAEEHEPFHLRAVLVRLIYVDRVGPGIVELRFAIGVDGVLLRHGKIRSHFHFLPLPPEVELAFLRIRIVHDLGVLIEGEVGLGSAEALRRCIHRGEDMIQGGRVRLRERGSGEQQARSEHQDWESHRLALFLLHPHFVTLQMPGSVFDGFDVGNADGSGNRLNNLFQLGVGISLGAHGRGLDLINEFALSSRGHDHSGKAWNVLDRLVLKIDNVRRYENEQEDQRDHDVVVKAAALVRPEDVSANCPPDRAHGSDGSLWHRQNCFGLVQVYLGIHGIANWLIAR